ncbi:MAG: molybdopterin dinucleotide-binding protein [Deltaproteobacteria bacterium]|nr:molybdopterin dinucleotide-binding protein [Deltaproteobacteria bacterium]
MSSPPSQSTPSEVRDSFCRFCHAACAIKVSVEGGRPVSVIGAKDNPVYHGYTCAKGRALPDQHLNPHRLLHTMKRGADGKHRPIPVEQAMEEVAAKISQIVEEHGPRSVALYTGTYSFPYPASAPMAVAWMTSLGSPMFFTSATIDQPGKMIAPALHGRWGGGPYHFDAADVWMLVGANPTIAKSIGIPCMNPAKRLHDALKRGLELIVIDPRRSETAKVATVHLQPKPGEDPTILAGMIRVILTENLADDAFLSAHTRGFEGLRAAVDPFRLDYVERRAGVPGAEVERAARIFAAHRNGGGNVGTGPNMAARGNLSEYLTLALNTLVGHWRREGERVPNPGVLMAAGRAKAQATPPYPGWGFGESMRVRNLTNTVAGLPTAALADEILLPGEGQVKALFSLGGNPMAAWPDQHKTLAAMNALELNVSLDIKMSATARLADYVIAPRLSLEVPGMTLATESLTPYAMGYAEPYAQYSPAVVDPPEGSDVIEEWEFFYGLAQRMKLPLSISAAYEWGPDTERPARTEIDMQNKPSNDSLFAALTQGSRISLDEVKKYPEGRIFEDPPAVVAAGDPDSNARMELADPRMIAELAEVAAEPIERDTEFAYRLVSRRLPDVHNSAGRDLPQLLRKYSYNPAFMNPVDLDHLGLAPGDVVEITSSHASILGVVEAEEAIRIGVVSMAHAFGDAPGGDQDKDVYTFGSNTGRLSSVDRDFDPYSGIPLMSAIPVNVERALDSALG